MIANSIASLSVATGSPEHFARFFSQFLGESGFFVHRNFGGDLAKRTDPPHHSLGQSGYQSLTEEEKKILFEASKKLN